MLHQLMFISSEAEKEWDEANVDNPISVLTLNTINGTTNKVAILEGKNDKYHESTKIWYQIRGKFSHSTNSLTNNLRDLIKL